MTFLVTSPPRPGYRLWPCRLPHVADLNKGRCSFNYPGRNEAGDRDDEDNNRESECGNSISMLTITCILALCLLTSICYSICSYHPL